MGRERIGGGGESSNKTIVHCMYMYRILVLSCLSSHSNAALHFSHTFSSCLPLSSSAGKLLTLLVNGLELCDPLGDKNVWGSLSNLTEEQLGNGGAIMLTAKVKAAYQRRFTQPVDTSELPTTCT